MRYIDISTDFIDKEFFIVLCTTDELISITNIKLNLINLSKNK